MNSTTNGTLSAGHYSAALGQMQQACIDVMRAYTLNPTAVAFAALQSMAAALRELTRLTDESRRKAGWGTAIVQVDEVGRTIRRSV